MKVGTLTLHLPFNYGNALQLFSLHKYLLEQGYDAEVLSHWYYKNRNEILYLHHATKGLHATLHFLIDCLTFPDVVCQYRRETKLVRWLSSKIKWSAESGITGEFDPNRLPHDTIIVGSDQIWNPIHETSKFFLLPDFPNRMKKVAYAASMGTDIFIDSEVDFFANSMKRFSAISVRESSAAKICCEKFGVDAALVCDPTLLHTKEQWCKLLDIKLNDNVSKDLVVYLVTPDFKSKWRDLIAVARKAEGHVHFFAFQWSHLVPRFSFVHPLKALKRAIFVMVKRILMYCAGVRLHLSATPTEFVKFIANSSGILTDSFHGMIFATIFGKKCNVIVGEHVERQQMSARLRDFANKFGFPEIITERFDLEAMRQLNVTPKLQELIVFSKNWLHDVIEK